MTALADNDRKKPLLLLIRSLNQGGAERQVTTLAIMLHKAGIPAIVTTFYSGGPLQADLEAAGVPVHCIDKSSRWDLPIFLCRLVTHIREQQPHTIYSFLAVPNLLALALKPLAGPYHVVWGIRSSEMELKRYDWLARLTYRVEQQLARLADLIISNSYAGRRDAVSRGFPDTGRFVVVPNGIDTSRFVPESGSRESIRAEWDVSGDHIVVGVVGRFDPKKGHTVLLQAVAEAARDNPLLRFVCIGSGTQEREQSLKSLARELGLDDTVIWAGPYNDMPAVYNAMDFLCLPSIYGEGFPNVVGEAMACAKPCIVTDVGDAALIVGDTGKVVPPNDPRRLAAAILSIANYREPGDPGTRARSRITDRFSSETLFENTLQALETT